MILKQPLPNLITSISRILCQVGIHQANFLRNRKYCGIATFLPRKILQQSTVIECDDLSLQIVNNTCKITFIKTGIDSLGIIPKGSKYFHSSA